MPSITSTTKIKIQPPYGKPKYWALWVKDSNGTERNYSDRVNFKLVKRLNQLWYAEIEIFGVQRNTNIQKDDLVKIFSENKIVFKGIIKEIDYIT